jgi:hypothetical protein
MKRPQANGTKVAASPAIAVDVLALINPLVTAAEPNNPIPVVIQLIHVSLFISISC